MIAIDGPEPDQLADDLPRCAPSAARWASRWSSRHCAARGGLPGQILGHDAHPVPVGHMADPRRAGDRTIPTRLGKSVNERVGKSIVKPA